MTPILLEAPPAQEERLTIPYGGTYREIQSGYKPGRSLGLSALLHNLALCALVFLPGHLAFVATHTVVVKPLSVQIQEQSVVYMPVLGGGSEGTGDAGGASGSADEVADGVRARSRRGFAYPGKQPTVSNPPGAHLGTQTILQPSIENLPLLRREVPLPNIVKPAPVVAAEPVQAPLVVKAERIAMRPAPEPLPIAPKLTLPAASATTVAQIVDAAPNLPKALEKPKAPSAPDIAESNPRVHDENSLLVLNAVPPPPDVRGEVPRAEARSLFAVVPSDTTVIADPAAGSKTGALSSSTGSGNKGDIAQGDAVASIASGGNRNRGTGGSGTGEGGRIGSGHGPGLNATVTGSGNGRGASTGPGTGTGFATVQGSGSGGGRAPGSGGFPGIAIQGGQYGKGDSASLNASINSRRQTSYNMTIVSTASSGGGLPDVGVFHNEKVYTVYLDMKANDEDTAPSWILQYSVLQPGSGPADAGVEVKRIRGTPKPPYAMLKAVPGFSPEVLRRCHRTLIVAYAIMNTSGKLEQISVKQTPDGELVAPLVEALSGWSFQPAEIDGQPVPLKMLLGIRLAVR